MIRLRWRVELGCFDFDIKYRPGEENIPADSFSRLYCSTMSSDKLYQLHDSLCHPGVTRMVHFLRTKNLVVAIDEVKNMIASCRICAEGKPHFIRSNENKLVKATQPFKWLSIDFKVPLPSSTNNKYFLTITDEYSRFPLCYTLL